ncbi:SGNH/GDSL hydrolase family protein [Mucilaginibacter sp. FT3.2]|uniref:SGNH/GDSL hydrolase family protein n=1 Tax=Mucilaginibacter sp. FT3.2 TaxID=2723090 RepID=UPI001618095C|nr:SGNH/GDSL hydrolase family protein [Mucilaginibacter sp. FT3.2]MBB6229966.1 lysophospholipase L1-like esterase [Mucilaginibacter sp. FT3.2]
MKGKLVIAVILAVMGFGRAYGNTKGADTIFAENLKPLGRTIINSNGGLELITSAAHFGFSFTGTECAVYVSIAAAGQHNYLQYTLDGVYQKRVRIEGGSHAPVIIKADGTGKHTVWIYKATEAHTGALIIAKIAAPGIKNMPIPKLPLIEFIGNSITCGAAADDSEVPCGTGDYHDHHNAYMAYGPSVSRALNANFVLTSVSGIGIYRTWNRDTPSMPLVYENVDFQVGNPQKWNFSVYSPKIVSIALGTNDMSKGDGSPRAAFDTLRFVTDYVKFVQLVKSKYPKAQIALLSSPMIKDTSRQILQRCLLAIKKQIDTGYPNDKPVATFFFEPMEPHGCSGHPSVADHQILAEELKPFFGKLLKGN